MRNLITLNKGKFKPTASTAEGDEDDLSFTLLDSVFDTLSDSITCVLGSTDIGAIEVQQFMKDGSRNVLASFNIQTFDDKLLSFVHFADINQLVFVFEQGDIITATYDPVSLDPAETLIEIMGEDKAFAYLKELDKNIAQYTKTGLATANISTGAAAVDIGFMHTYVREMDKVAPVIGALPCEGTGYR